MASSRVPVATYRLQLSASFRFQDACSLVAYLHRLGISDLYLSPIFQARRGSSHGYDVTDPSRLNPELGTEEEFDRLVAEVKAHGMGLLMDLVPNHMAASPENPWWADVLESGPCSPCAVFFDIDWDPGEPGLEGRVLLPLLATPYRQALRDRELRLALDGGGICLCYRGLRLPLEVGSYGVLLGPALERLEVALGPNSPAVVDLKGLLKAARRLGPYRGLEGDEAQARYVRGREIKSWLQALVASSPEVKASLEGILDLFSDEGGGAGSSGRLDRLLAKQPFRLAHWKTGRKRINYRRFFDISDLVGVRVEEESVFDATHALALRLAREGRVTGLRIDHIDGLYDPMEYLARLQDSLSPGKEGVPLRPGFYLVVEKILARGEHLREEWPVSGTTGYDFLSTLNALLVDDRGARVLRDDYLRSTGSALGFGEVVYRAKRQVMEELFQGEVHALGHHLAMVARGDPEARTIPGEELAEALVEVTACLPVYRTYTRTLHVSEGDRRYIEQAVEDARRRRAGLEGRALRFVQQVLLLDVPPASTREDREAWLQLVMRWQQLSGPVMAKGVEDTALYRYTPLVSLNEVGGDPSAPGLSIEAFHRGNMERLALWPHTLNTTATHDTNRGEDVRARLNVLSEVPEEWVESRSRWSRWNSSRKRRLRGRPVPEPAMEALIYQTLLGAWPLSGQSAVPLRERLREYTVKAAREAKSFTRWLKPDPGYEGALLEFLDSLLDGSHHDRFLDDLLSLERRVAWFGALNSLAQVVLKIGSPGVPDFYQGSELWDLSLVDPDNRRPVDFEHRKRLLEGLSKRETADRPSLVREILASWEDGRVKLYVTHKALVARRDHREVITRGEYIPIQAEGERGNHLCAFGRRRGSGWALVVVPRFLCNLTRPGIWPLGHPVWGDDTLPLPPDAPGRWLNVFTGEDLAVSPQDGGAPLSTVLGTFPVALLIGGDVGP